MAEARDATDTSQLLLFIRGVNGEFEVTTISICTQHVWVYQGRGCFLRTFRRQFLNTALSGSNLNVWRHTVAGRAWYWQDYRTSKGKIYSLSESVGCTKPVTLCYLSGSTLRQVCGFVTCYGAVLSTVHFMRLCGLNHHQFCTILSDSVSESCDFAVCNVVRWLSRCSVLLRFCALWK